MCGPHQVWPLRSECCGRGVPTKVVCAECMKMCCLGGKNSVVKGLNMQFCRKSDDWPIQVFDVYDTKLCKQDTSFEWQIHAQCDHAQLLYCTYALPGNSYLQLSYCKYHRKEMAFSICGVVIHGRSISRKLVENYHGILTSIQPLQNMILFLCIQIGLRLRPTHTQTIYGQHAEGYVIYTCSQTL